MNVGMLGILVIAALFVLVTAGLAIGPLLWCRLVAAGGAAAECRPQPPSRSFGSLLLGFGCAALAMLLAVVGVYFANSQQPEQATVVMDVAAIDGDAESLFAQHRVPPLPPQQSVDSIPTASFILLTLVLLLTSLLALSSRAVRRAVLVSIPVLLAIGLLVALTTWSVSVRQVDPVVHHDAFVASTSEVVHSDHREAPDVTVTPEQDRAGSSKNDWEPAGPSADMEATAAIIAYDGTATAGVPRETLPEWVSAASHDGPIQVVDSGKHATIKLAEEHALAELTTLVQNEFVRRYPQADGWQPRPELLLNADNILQRAIQRSQIQVGEFTTPMFEAYWQVDTSDIVPLYEAWRPSVVQQRLLWMAGGVGLLTLLLGSLAGVLRVDEQTNGQRRKSLAAGTLALWAIVGGALLFVA